MRLGTSCEANDRPNKPLEKQQLETGTHPAWGSKKAQDEQWRQLRDQRRQQLKQEDEIWRQKRLNIRTGLSDLGLVTSWIAVLVVVDNCTRQSLGLPLFVAGSNLTAELVVEALLVLLPPELQFLITGRGTPFTANILTNWLKAGSLSTF